MADDELTPATIIDIAWEVHDGTANPEDARRLLAHFCDLINRGEPVPESLNRHLADAFGAYLSETRTLEAALGLARRRGRPNVDEERTRMAAEVIRSRLYGSSHQDALAAVGTQFHRSESIVSEAFRDHAAMGYILLRMERVLDSKPWTPDEIARLTAMFGDKDWWFSPK
jgi:hypothetical protein